jgi:hypothetical protein
MVGGAGFKGDAVDASVGGEGGDCLDPAAWAKARLDPTVDGLLHRSRVTPRGNAFSQARRQGEHSLTIGLLERPYLDPHGWQCFAFVRRAETVGCSV